MGSQHGVASNHNGAGIVEHPIAPTQETAVADRNCLDGDRREVVVGACSGGHAQGGIVGRNGERVDIIIEQGREDRVR